jgi:hypothetical protein
MLGWPSTKVGGPGDGLGRSGGPCGPGRLVSGLLGRLLERRMTDRRTGGVALGPAGGASGRSRCRGRRAERAQQPWKPATHPIGRQSRLGSGPLPRQPLIGGGLAGQAQLGVAGQHQPGPRSACSGWRGCGVVQPRVCLQNRTVCSRSKRRTYARQARSRSSSPEPDHHNHNTFGGRVLAGTRSTWTRRMVPCTIGRASRLP